MEDSSSSRGFPEPHSPQKYYFFDSLLDIEGGEELVLAAAGWENERTRRTSCQR